MYTELSARYQVVKATEGELRQQVIDYKKVWTWEGRVFAEVEGERIHIKSVEDIPGLENPAPKPAVTPFLAGFDDEEL